MPTPGGFAIHSACWIGDQVFVTSLAGFTVADDARTLAHTNDMHKVYDHQIALASCRGAIESKVSRTDPDACAMTMPDGCTALGYQSHYLVDGGKARVILHALVTPGMWRRTTSSWTSSTAPYFGASCVPRAWSPMPRTPLPPTSACTKTQASGPTSSSKSETSPPSASSAPPSPVISQRTSTAARRMHHSTCAGPTARMSSGSIARGNPLAMSIP